MAAYCAGDEGAFRRLFQRYGGRIYSFLLHTTGERTQAEDLSQQTWLKLHRARGSFDGGSRFAAWLYTIAANLRRDEARVRRRRPEDLTIDGQVPPFAASFEPQVSAEAEAVRRALLSLPEDQRSIIVLHRYHDLGMAEIAALHGISESAAKVRAFRGYERLRELLRAEVPA